MLESLLFMTLMIMGGFFLIVLLVIIIIGLVKKKIVLSLTGVGIGVILAFCFGLIFYWYGIAMPSFSEDKRDDYAGT